MCPPMIDLVLFHAALADETRLRLLCLMQKREICVCHLQSVLQTNQPKISRHLAYLKRAGLVFARRDGKWTHYKIRILDAELNKILAGSLTRYAKLPTARQDAKKAKKVMSC